MNLLDKLENKIVFVPDAMLHVKGGTSAGHPSTEIRLNTTSVGLALKKVATLTDDASEVHALSQFIVRYSDLQCSELGVRHYLAHLANLNGKLAHYGHTPYKIIRVLNLFYQDYLGVFDGLPDPDSSIPAIVQIKMFQAHKKTGLKPRTLENHIYWIAKLYDAYHESQVQELGKAQIDQFLADMEIGKASASNSSITKALQAMAFLYGPTLMRKGFYNDHQDTLAKLEQEISKLQRKDTRQSRIRYWANRYLAHYQNVPCSELSKVHVESFLTSSPLIRSRSSEASARYALKFLHDRVLGGFKDESESPVIVKLMDALDNSRYSEKTKNHYLRKITSFLGNFGENEIQNASPSRISEVADEMNLSVSSRKILRQSLAFFFGPAFKECYGEDSPKAKYLNACTKRALLKGYEDKSVKGNYHFFEAFAEFVDSWDDSMLTQDKVSEFVNQYPKATKTKNKQNAAEALNMVL